MKKIFISILCIFLALVIIGCVVYPTFGMQDVINGIKKDFSPVINVFNTVSIIAKQLFTNGEFRDIPISLQGYLQSIATKGTDEYYDFQWFLLYSAVIGDEYNQREIYKSDYIDKYGNVLDLCVVAFTFEYQDFYVDPFDIYVLFSVPRDRGEWTNSNFEIFDIYGVYLPKYKVVGDLLDIPSCYSFYYGKSDALIVDIEKSGWIDSCYWRPSGLSGKYKYYDIVNRVEENLD